MIYIIHDVFQVSVILQKPEEQRTEEDKEVLQTCSDVVKEVAHR